MLQEQDAQDTQVYSRLFSATQESRSYARFDLYDAQGTWRYSTHNAPDQKQLPTNWGVLQQAREQTKLELIACQDVTQTNQPMLQGAVCLEDRDGQTAGYLVVSLYQSGLRQLMEGAYGNQNDLILLSHYWRPVYCAQPSLASSLAPVCVSGYWRGSLSAAAGMSSPIRWNTTSPPDSIWCCERPRP